MALTIDATVGGASANSYLTIADADAIMEARYHTSTIWSTLTDAIKTQLLVSATFILDGLKWEGYKASETQALRWPRTYAYDCDRYAIASDEIPQSLKIAVCEMAIQYYKSDKFTDSGTEGFSAIAVGPIKLNIDKYDRASLIPRFISQMLRCLINDASSGGGAFSVPVKRV